MAEFGLEAGAVPGVLSLIFSLSPVGVAAGVESGFEGVGLGGRLSLDSESESSVEASSGHSLNSIPVGSHNQGAVLIKGVTVCFLEK